MFASKAKAKTTMTMLRRNAPRHHETKIARVNNGNVRDSRLSLTHVEQKLRVRRKEREREKKKWQRAKHSPPLPLTEKKRGAASSSSKVCQVT